MTYINPTWGVHIWCSASALCPAYYCLINTTIVWISDQNKMSHVACQLLDIFFPNAHPDHITITIIIITYFLIICLCRGSTFAFFPHASSFFWLLWFTPAYFPMSMSSLCVPSCISSRPADWCRDPRCCIAPVHKGLQPAWGLHSSREHTNTRKTWTLPQVLYKYLTWSDNVIRTDNAIWTD